MKYKIIQCNMINTFIQEPHYHVHTKRARYNIFILFRYNIFILHYFILLHTYINGNFVSSYTRHFNLLFWI